LEYPDRLAHGSATHPELFRDAALARQSLAEGDPPVEEIGLDPAHDELVRALALGRHAGKTSVV
ncbi:MAG TPA: hypothetical protein VN683_11790, partial [Acidothermaceae bacterium]|nr:hypothetical protein [Acidothermaceae bacterium]